MELYKLNSPNVLVDNITDYSFDKEDECDDCQIWRHYYRRIEKHLAIKRLDERNVDDDIIRFLSVYKIPPYEYVHQFLKD